MPTKTANLTEIGDLTNVGTAVIRFSVKNDQLVPTTASAARETPRTSEPGEALISRDQPKLVTIADLYSDLHAAGYLFDGFTHRPSDVNHSVFAAFRRDPEISPARIGDEGWTLLHSLWSAYVFINRREDQPDLITINLGARVPFFVDDDPSRGHLLVWPKGPNGKADKSGGPDSKIQSPHSGAVRLIDGHLFLESA